jgi:hypothetical protein
MAHLERLIQKSEGLTYEGKGKFVAQCPGNTCEDCKLTFQMDISEEWGANKPMDWHGKFSCQKNCSTIQIFSNLEVPNHEIFFDHTAFESCGGNWDSILGMEESKEFLRDLSKMMDKVISGPESDWKSELERHGLGYYFLGTIRWLLSDGDKYFSYQSEKKKFEKKKLKNIKNSKDKKAFKGMDIDSIL